MKKIIATIGIVIAFLYTPVSLGVIVNISAPTVKAAQYNKAKLFGANIDPTLNQGFCQVWSSLLLDNGMIANIINKKINLIGLPDAINPNTGTAGTSLAPNTTTPGSPPATVTPSQTPATTTPNTITPSRTITAPTTTTPSVTAPKTGASTSAYASEVVNLVNKERAAQGLPALKVNSAVTAAAQKRATETATKFSHTRPNGTKAFTALSEAKVSYRGAGENIAMGQTTPARVMDGWMKSTGHRANILDSKFTNIGVGCFKDATGQYYWAQLFTY